MMIDGRTDDNDDDTTTLFLVLLLFFWRRGWRIDGSMFDANQAPLVQLRHVRRVV